MAQYIALLGAAMSILAPSKKNDNVGGGGSTGRIGVPASTSFSSGIVMGLALGAVIMSQCQKHRIKERIRYSFFTWLGDNDEGVDDENDDSDEKNMNKNSIEKIEIQDKINHETASVNIGEDASMQIIANCNNSLSPNLHCSKITLKRGTKTKTQSSKGVEVYYILYGIVEFIVNDKQCSVKVHQNILIQPWT